MWTCSSTKFCSKSRSFRRQGNRNSKNLSTVSIRPANPSSELIEKLEENQQQSFQLFKVLRAHLLPLTNCAFNKGGDKFITGSYDRTCKVWDTITGAELLSLEEHKNVVYTMAFNNPFGDKIVTGSFDKTAKVSAAPPDSSDLGLQDRTEVPHSQGTQNGNCLPFLRPSWHACGHRIHGHHC